MWWVCSADQLTSLWPPVFLREQISSVPITTQQIPARMSPFGVHEWSHSSSSWMTLFFLLADVFLKPWGSWTAILLCFRMSAVWVQEASVCVTILSNQMWLYSRHFNQLRMINTWRSAWGFSSLLMSFFFVYHLVWHLWSVSDMVGSPYLLCRHQWIIFTSPFYHIIQNSQCSSILILSFLCSGLCQCSW